ncbi:MAG: hypothetical protein JSR77_07720 [Planctomycetes bacterium]|nr:hypothetical protein [Planctomycetota bacterium]
MAGNQYLSKYQQGIVNRYYQHQDARVVQRLQELVSDLCVCTEEKAAAKKWAVFEREIAKTNADPVRVAKAVKARDLKAAAAIIADPKLSAAAAKPRPPQAKSATDDI